MFTIEELLQPASLEEAKQMLADFPDLVVLGGCGFLKLGSRRIRRAMDLSRCGLESVDGGEESIRIGAMAPLYSLEINPALKRLFDGIVPRAVGHILGTQFRRCATVGASVYSRYGFSDLLPALLVLDTEVELLRGGSMPLREFLDRPITGDILTQVRIRVEERRASYQCLRNASADFPILNAAVSLCRGSWRIVVGARPGRALIAEKTSGSITALPPAGIDADRIAAAVSEEVSFGGNNRASADYRRKMCEVLVKRAIGEIAQCK